MFTRFLVILALGLPACGASGRPEPSTPAAAEAPQQERERLFQLGARAAKGGDSVRAEQYLSMALERGYPKERALPMLLQVCLAGSRLRSALDHAEPYLQEHPELDALRFLVANIRLGLGQQDRALEQLDLLLRRNPRFDDALFLRAVLLMPRDADASRNGFRDYLDVAPHGPHSAESRSRLSELALHEASTGTKVSERAPEVDP